MFEWVENAWNTCRNSKVGRVVMYGSGLVAGAGAFVLMYKGTQHLQADWSADPHGGGEDDNDRGNSTALVVNTLKNSVPTISSDTMQKLSDMSVCALEKLNQTRAAICLDEFDTFGDFILELIQQGKLQIGAQLTGALEVSSALCAPNSTFVTNYDETSCWYTLTAAYAAIQAYLYALQTAQDSGKSSPTAEIALLAVLFVAYLSAIAIMCLNPALRQQVSHGCEVIASSIKRCFWGSGENNNTVSTNRRRTGTTRAAALREASMEEDPENGRPHEAAVATVSADTNANDERRPLLGNN